MLIYLKWASKIVHQTSQLKPQPILETFPWTTIFSSFISSCVLLPRPLMYPASECFWYLPVRADYHLFLLHREQQTWVGLFVSSHLQLPSAPRPQSPSPPAAHSSELEWPSTMAGPHILFQTTKTTILLPGLSKDDPTFQDISEGHTAKVISPPIINY